MAIPTQGESSAPIVLQENENPESLDLKFYSRKKPEDKVNESPAGNSSGKEDPASSTRQKHLAAKANAVAAKAKGKAKGKATANSKRKMREANARKRKWEQDRGGPWNAKKPRPPWRYATTIK